MIDKDVYVIKPKKNNLYGLGALIIETLKYTQYADQKGYIPYVDWTGFNTQYGHNEAENAWNYYFNQPIKAIDLKKSKYKIHYSNEEDLSFFQDEIRIKKSFELNTKIQAKKLFFKYYSFSNEINIRCNKENVSTEKTIGLLLRGTDYQKLMPKGHAIQPNINDVVREIDFYLKNTNARKIFLVTEDYSILNSMIKIYGKKIIKLKSDYHIKDYQGKNVLALEPNSLEQLGSTPKERGAQYLTKLILLSRCEYLIVGNTCGSWFSFIISESLREPYIFDIGKY